MIKAVIIDDEKSSRDTLNALIIRYCPEVHIVGMAEGFVSGLELLERIHPELLFLDIQMPDGSGFKLIEAVSPVNFSVIFTTAYDQYALKAIKCSALDYLLKPIVPEDLITAVSKYKNTKKDAFSDKRIDYLLENINAPDEEQFKTITFNTNSEIIKVAILDIIRCEADNCYTTFYIKDNRKLIISKTLKEYEDLLGETHFLRVHKSHLININYIDSFNKADNGFVVLKTGDNIPVSRRKRDKIIEILKKFSFSF